MNEYVKENWLKLLALFSFLGYFGTGVIFSFISSGWSVSFTLVMVSGVVGLLGFLLGQIDSTYIEQGENS